MSTDALEKIENENVKEFLECHRNDIGNTEKIKRLSKQIRFGAIPMRVLQPRAKKRLRIDEFAFPAHVPITNTKVKSTPQAKKDGSTATTSASSSDSASDYEPSMEKKCPERKTENKEEIVSTEVVSVIDRCQISDQDAMLLMSTTLNAAGKDIGEVNLSRSTIGRRRRSTRAEIVGSIRNTFETVDSFLTVHYDEKKLRDFTGGVERQNATVNRLAIVVSFDKGFKLLEIPKIINGSGATVAKAVHGALEKWNLTRKVQALCFDTTSSNTGLRSGSAFILEGTMKRPILFFACRHHISELLLKKAFELTMEPDTSGPNIAIFNRFKTAWPTIKVDNEKIQANSALKDTQIQQYFPPHIRDELVQFAYKQLNTHHDRPDYIDFVHMVLLFLGETPLDSKGKSKKVKVPGAISRARFMAMAIYNLKIYLFRDQFSLTGTFKPNILVLNDNRIRKFNIADAELANLRDMNVFIVTIYMRYWFECPLPSDAPKNDLRMVTNLIEYRNINEKIAEEVLTVLFRHLWYLSETLIGLAFFDRTIDAQTKRLMVAALEKESNNKSCKQASIDAKFETYRGNKKCIILDSVNVSKLNIDGFVTSNTKIFFESLFANDSNAEDPNNFLKIDPSRWINNEKYLRAEEIVKKMVVVNDAAERAINLITRFNEKVTTIEDEKQMVLQVVEAHQKLFPYSITKKDIIKNMQKPK